MPLKYSPDSVKVIITYTSDEENVTVCVQDFGVGIAAQMQEKVFERFYRLYDGTTHSYPGLDVNLHIVSEIVKDKSGTVKTKSKKNEGSVFCFTIPLKYFR